MGLTDQRFGVREEGVVVNGWFGANGKRLFSVGVSVLAICLLVVLVDLYASVLNC